MPNDPEWKYIHAAADLFVKQLTDGVELVLKDLQKEIDISDIESALERNDPAYLINIIDWEDRFDDRLLNQYTKVVDSIMAITGAEAWKRLNVEMSFNIRNPYAELYIAEHGAKLVTAVSEETKAAIRAVVLDGFQSGFPPRDMAKRIINMIGLTERDTMAAFNYWKTLAKDIELSTKQIESMTDNYAKRLLRRRALNIARTETINAANQGTLNSWRTAQDNGFVLPETQKEWIAATMSDRTCIHCMPMDGQKVGLDEKFVSKTLGKKVDGPTLHPNCLVPGTEVVAPSLVCGYERWFEGEVITITTSNGDKLTVTPNHPILTRNGWVSASRLNIGDNIVRCSDSQLMAFIIEPNNQNIPTVIEQITNTLRMNGGMVFSSMPISTEDFHGDGTDGNVDIIYSDRKLGNGINSFINKPIIQNNFIFRTIGIVVLSRFGYFCDMFKRHFASSDGIMGRLRKKLSFFCRKFGHSNNICFASGSSDNTSIFQNSFDCISIDSKLFRQRQFGFSHNIKLSNLFIALLKIFISKILSPFYITYRCIFGNSAQCNTVLNQNSLNSNIGSLIGFNYIADCFPGLIAETDITDIQTSRVRTHVYNLQTNTGWYISNNIITHNCRCAIALVTPRIS